jgi:hypothetical protein
LDALAGFRARTCYWSHVPHQGHVIAEFCAAAGGSLDAGIGQHPYHDDLLDAALLELESATGIDGVTTRKPRFAGYQGKRLCV